MTNVKYKEDFSLLHRYLCGDDKAGETLFSKAYPIVRKFVFEKTKTSACLTEEDKEDIIFEAMTRAIDKQYLYNGTSRFQNFIIGFAVNIIFEQNKKKVADISKAINIEELEPESFRIYDNPIEVIIRKEELDSIQKALAELPEEQKTVLILRLFNEMSFKEVVELVGKSEAAVDSLFRRAIKSFKKNFEKIYFGATDF